jgi:integrase
VGQASGPSAASTCATQKAAACCPQPAGEKLGLRVGPDLDQLQSVHGRPGAQRVAIPSALAEELARHYQRTAFKGDAELVFCHPKRGTVYAKELWTPQFAAALKAAGINDHVRPFHDLRHTAITLDAASGASGAAVMTKAGHSSFATTQTYLHLAGTVFREEAERMERMALGGSSTEPSTDLSEPQGTEQDAAGLTARE